MYGQVCPVYGQGICSIILLCPLMEENSKTRKKLPETKVHILQNFTCQHLLEFPLSVQILKEEQMTTWSDQCWFYTTETTDQVFSPELLQMFRNTFCTPAGMTTFYHWSQLSSVNRYRDLQFLSLLLKSSSLPPHSSSRNCILNWTASNDATPL